MPDLEALAARKRGKRSEGSSVRGADGGCGDRGGREVGAGRFVGWVGRGPKP